MPRPRGAAKYPAGRKRLSTGKGHLAAEVVECREGDLAKHSIRGHKTGHEGIQAIGEALYGRPCGPRRHRAGSELLVDHALLARF